MKDTISKIFVPKIEFPSIPKIEFPCASFDFASVLPDTKEISQILANVTRPLIDTGAFVKSYQESIRDIFEAQQAVFKDIADQIAKALPKIPSLSISEERIQEIRDALRVWGEYGWTIPDHARASNFFNAPSDIKEANKIAMQYCKPHQMEALFEKTKEFKGFRLSDYKEAVADYRDRRYRSCALIIFSLIDARLIRMQGPDDLVRGKRPSGKRAAKNALGRIKENQIDESMCFALFRYENLYACLMKVFEEGKDFKKQPVIINRNYLDHGMLTSNVRKRDCIQLFLLYYNWLSFLDWID